MSTKKILRLSFVVLVSFIFLSSLSSSIEEHYRNANLMKVYAPEKINVFESYKIKVVIPTEDRKNYDLIGVSGACSIDLDYTSGKSKSKPEVHDSSHYKYNGEKELDLLIRHITNEGTVRAGSFIDEKGNEKVFLSDCTIILKKSSDITNYSSGVYVDFKPEFYSYNFGIGGLEDFKLENPDEDSTQKIVSSLWKRYLKQSDGQEIKLLMKVESALDKNREVYSYGELTSPSLDKFNIKTTQRAYEEVRIGKETAHIHYSCENPGGSKYNQACAYDGFVLKPFGLVRFEMKARTTTPLEEYDDIAKIEEEWKSVFIRAIESTYFKSGGKTVEVKIEDRNDDCGDCKIGYVCSACGKCIKEKDAINPDNVLVEFSLDVSQTDKKILNAIESQAIFRVSPKLKLSYEGKSVSYCNLIAPGFDATIEAEMISNESYSGFTTGFVNDERERKSSCKFDLSDSKSKCAFILSPNDRKKFIEDAKDIIQEINFSAKIKDAESSVKKEITLTPPKLKLSLNGKTKQIHQGKNGLFEAKVNGAITKKVIIKLSLIGPGKIGLDSKNINEDWILKTINNGDSLKVAYLAPALGNFDIGSELESLSMANLQKDAAIAIALDATTAYGGDYAGELEALVEAGKYSKKMGHLTDTFKAVNGVRSLIELDKNIDGMQGEVGDAMSVNDKKSEATTTERIADIGVAGISIAQTAVSVLTFVPNKIPGVGRLTAGVQTAFSAATNIWKANLQYISKSEQIERAKELYYPVPVIVTAQDLSGWTTQETHIFQIAYHQVD